MDRFSLYAKKTMKKNNVKNFKKTMGKFTTGITVVCVKKNNKIYGKTVNSFNSLSLNPPLVLFSLGNYSSSINDFLNCKFLSINILSSKQKNISDIFAKNKPSINKIDFYEGPNNTSLIHGCIGNLECKLISKIHKGDHVLFINQVINVDYNNKLKPLCYFNSKYIK